MSKDVARPPILVIGMHRSGTTMVARLLDELGVFMGWRLLDDHEPVLMVRLNNWLLSQCGGSWDRPLPIRDLIDHRPARALATSYLRAQLAGPRAISYLGPRRFLEHGRVECLTGAWGWKDPRSTFTLPLWLDLFPEARVLHISRHGVDVADSLRRRHEVIFARRRARFERHRRLAGVFRKRAGFTTSLRVATLEGGLGLWEEYMAEAHRHVERLGSRALEVRYEDLLKAPHEELTRIVSFFELSASSEAIAEVIGAVRSDRAFSFQMSEEAMAMARRHSARLAAFGYAE